MGCCRAECEVGKNKLRNDFESCKGEIRLYRKMLSLMIESGKLTKEEVKSFRQEAKNQKK